jgi:alpha-beta hydrolase superfamily lysophospholipase
MHLDAFSLQSDNAGNMTDSKDKTKAQKGGSSQRYESHFKGYQGLELFLQSWQNSKDTPPSRGTLVITHGMGEHSECYHHTAEALVAMGWTVVSWDLRGHGRSEGKRGYIADFGQYALDLGFFLRHLKNADKLAGPFALIGHSMGGLITLRHLLNELNEGMSSPTPHAVTLSSPLLGVALAVPVVKDLAAKFLYRVIPSITLFNEIKYEDLTRDPVFLKSYASDTLRHDKISPGIYLGMLENMALVKEQASRIQLPMLVQAAGEDKVVSLQAIREFFPILGSKEKSLIVYEGSYHEIFNDLDRSQVYKDLDVFLTQQVAQQVTQQTTQNLSKPLKG